MNTQQQPGGFGGNRSGRRFNDAGSGRPNFGGRDFSRGGRDGGQAQLFRATCSDCGKPCEVPFRPSGERAVYCKECFAKRRENPQHGIQKQRIVPPSSLSPQQVPEVRLVDVKRQLDALNAKVDTVLLRIGAGPGTALGANEKSPAVPKRATKKSRKPSKSSKK